LCGWGAVGLDALTVMKGFPYVVSRIWSNESAAAGHDPCVPAYPGEVYFVATAELNDHGTFTPLDGFSPPASVSAIHIGMGQTRILKVDLYSDGQDPGFSWTVTPRDWRELTDGTAPLLSFSPESQTGKNGDTLEFSITVNEMGDGVRQAFGTELFTLDSVAGPGAKQHWQR